MATSVVPTSWQDFFRRNERRLAAAWLALSLLLLVALILRPTRVMLLARIQQVADYWDARWERRLQAGERLVDTGKFEEASAYLAKLDAEYPAPHARYGRDKEREHLLRLLARSYEGLGRNAKTMDTWMRLTQFDSLNHANHFGYAQAAERLLSGWALAPEARDGFARVLTLLPSHLPALRGFIDYYMDRGEFQPVVDAYRTYIDSYLQDRLSISVGDSTVVVPVQVDGRPHELDVDLMLPPGFQGEVRVSSNVYPVSIERVAVVTAAHVGQATERAIREVDISEQFATSWLTTTDPGFLGVPVFAGEAGSSRMLLRVRVFKLIDAPLWAQVIKSHRNLLDAAGLAEAQSRTRPFPSAAAADSAFARNDWLSGGRYVRGER